MSWLISQPDGSSSQEVKKIITARALLSSEDTASNTDETPTNPLTDSQAGVPSDALSDPNQESTQPSVETIDESTPATDVESALGFALPPNSVNSVTQEGVATRLVIPKLKVDAPIMLAPIENQTWNVSHLEQAVGHLEGTAPPGSNSNIVLAGHVTLAAGVYGPFAGLAQLETGDELIVYQGDQPFQYVVDGYQVVERTNVEVTYPSQTGQITLITCNNWNRDSNRYEQRIVVKGHLLNQ